MLFPWCPFLLFARREFRSVLYTPREPVKEASYERSKNAWRTCDLRICRRGPPARNLRHLLSFASRLLSPSAATFPPPFVFLLPLPPSVCFLATRSRPTAPLLRPADQSRTGFMSRPDFTNGRYPCSGAFRCVRRRTRLYLPQLQKIAVGKKAEGMIQKMFRIISCKLSIIMRVSAH